MTDPGAASQCEAPGRRRVAVDTCVLINLLRIGRLDILDESAYLFPVITQSVLDEITDEGQRESLESAIASGRILLLDPVDPASVDVFMAAIEGGLGRGEASCIALSAATVVLLGCDEKVRCFMRIVETNGLSGRIVTTRDLMIMAVCEGRLVIDEANALLGDLRTRFRYNVPGIQQGDTADGPPVGSD